MVYTDHTLSEVVLYIYGGYGLAENRIVWFALDP